MYLEEIELIGFKSFANKTVLKFPKPGTKTKGVTAIVGPNGSGKSNVADAMRWVLGESSSKTLRGKTRDDVIFSGSASKNRMNFAEVTLRINNESHTGGIEYSNLEITRRVFRNGDAEFLLNKNKVRREDIVMLLAKAGFGQKTYTVIGQGMADAVLSASLQERKEFFEEAAGVKQYQIKRQQALNKFEGARDNLGQTELTIKELEPRLKSLTRQVKKLEQREEIEKELREIQTAYYNHLHTTYQSQVNERNSEKSELEKSVKTLEKDIDALQQKMNKLYTGDSRQEVFESLQREYNQLIQEKNNHLRDEALIKAKKDAEYQKGGQSNIVWLNNKKDELNNEISELRHTIKSVTLQLESERQEKQRVEKEVEQFDKRISTVKQDLESYRTSQVEEFDEEDDLREIYSMQEKLLEQLMNAKDASQLEDLRNQARAIAAKMAVYMESMAAKKRSQAHDVTNLQQQLESLIEQKNQQNQKLSQINTSIHLQEDKQQRLNQEITDNEEEIEKINNEITIAQSQSDQSQLVQEIEKQLSELQAKIALLDRDITEIEKKIGEFNESEQEKKEEMIALQKENQTKQSELNRLSNQLNSINVEIAKHSIRLEDLEKEIMEEGLEIGKVKAFKGEAAVNEEASHQQIHSLKKQMEIIGGIDEETIREYSEIKDRYDFLTEQTGDLEQAIVSLEKVIEELDQTIRKQFDKAFKEINTEFQKYFAILFDGGKAELLKVTLEEEKKTQQQESTDAEATADEGSAFAKATADKADSVLETVNKIAKRIKEREKESYAGIEIKAEPPGKKISSINMLSGGERALTSIALISAIIANNNSPFVMLDEMDAALDESNATRFAHILSELSTNTQFIVITHTRATMSEAQLLYGVTMTDDGTSKLLSIELEDAEEMDVVRH